MAAVTIEGSQPSEGSGLIAGKGSQLGHGGEEGGGGEDTDALNGGQNLELGAKYGGILDELGDEGLELLDLAIEMTPMTFDGSEEVGAGGLLEPVFFPDTVIDQLITAGDEIGEESGVFLGFWGG